MLRRLEHPTIEKRVDDDVPRDILKVPKGVRIAFKFGRLMCVRRPNLNAPKFGLF